MIELRILGSVDLRHPDGRIVASLIAQPKRLALLAYLATASPRGFHRRDALLALFWPESDTFHARASLRKAVHDLRRTLGQAVVVTRGDEEIGVAAELLWCDVVAFESAVAAGELGQALELYRGDLLASFFVADAPGFEDWLERTRASLRSRAAAAAHRQAEQQESGRHLTLAVASARRAVELSTDERMLRGLIELLDRLGDRAGALRAYEEFATNLANELQAEPASETMALIQRIRMAAPLRPLAAGPPPASVGSEPAIATLSRALRSQYKIERELGAGAMAVVALAHDLRHHRRVAIKILRPELTSLMGPERFLREIDIVASLMHPHILPLHDSGEAEGLLYYVMPYVEGESLRGRLEREGRLPVEEALQISREVADALDYAHHRGFVHRDVKPENILLSRGHALVADFGVARAIGTAGSDHLTARGLGTGTPAYMSPEQISGEGPIDERTDVYAIGCVLHEMLTGKAPFGGPTPEQVLAQHLRDRATATRELRPDISPAIDAAIAKALARRPDDRFGSTAEFASALVVAPPAVAGRQTPRSRRKRQPALVAAAVLLSASIASWRTVMKPAGTVSRPGIVAVLPFRVAGADSSLRYLSHGMIDLLAAKLTGEAGPRAADARAVLAALSSRGDTALTEVSRETARDVAAKVGAGLILEGSVAGPPEHIYLTASLEDLRGGAPKIAAVDGPRDSLFVMLDKLTAELLALDAGTSPQQLSSLTTTSLEALKAYLNGQAAYNRGAFVEAHRSFDRALNLDSTFALAASALVEAQDWSPYARPDRPRHLAWKYRGRLSPRDQLVLAVRLGARYPRWSPVNLDIAADERLTQVMPESPEAWLALGDNLAHFGALGEISDARNKSRVAYQRALAIDSLWAPALSGLISLAAETDDQRVLARLVPRLLAQDSSEWTALAARWHLAVAERDQPAIIRFIENLRSANAGLICNITRGELGDSTGLAHVKSFLAIARQRAANPSERSRCAWVAWMHALNFGRPVEARAWLDSANLRMVVSYRILGWVIGTDTTGMDAAAQRAKSLAVDSLLPASWPSPLFLVEAGKLYHGDLTTVDRTVTRFRSDPALRDTVRENHLIQAQLLEAWAAVVRNSPQAAPLLDAADSMLVGRGEWATFELMNPLVARLYAQAGDTRRALKAIRRRIYIETFLHPTGLAETSRLEGLWASQNGDRAGAMAAYKRYLMLRTNPEPSMVPQRDSVRTELARLEQPAP